MWATAKPEKKTKNASGVARIDIWCLARCLGALWAAGPKGRGDGAQSNLLKPIYEKIFVSQKIGAASSIAVQNSPRVFGALSVTPQAPPSSRDFAP